MRICAQAPPHFSGMSFFLQMINCLIYINAKHVIVNDIYTIFRCQNISPVLKIFYNCTCLFMKRRELYYLFWPTLQMGFFFHCYKNLSCLEWVLHVRIQRSDIEEERGRGAKTLLSDPLPPGKFFWIRARSRKLSRTFNIYLSINDLSALSLSLFVSVSFIHRLKELNIR